MRDAQQFSGLLDSSHWQVGRIEHGQLDEKGCLVPPDVLVSDFSVLEFHDHYVRKFDALAGWRKSWEQDCVSCVKLTISSPTT